MVEIISDATISVCDWFIFVDFSVSFVGFGHSSKQGWWVEILITNLVQEGGFIYTLQLCIILDFQL